MTAQRRTVVTGLGTVNPVGNTLPETWKNILAGNCGIAAIAGFDASHYSSQVAGEVKNFNFSEHYTERTVVKARRLDKFVHYGVAAGREALADSQLVLAATDKTRVGVVLGTGIGGMHVNTRESSIYLKKGNKRISPFYIPALIGNMAAGVLAIEHGLQGPNLSTQTACASANHAMAVAQYAILAGDADVMLSGGTEGIVEAMTVAGFCNMRALSTKYNHAPETASRPFDKGRDGFVIGEGAGVLVIEELAHARARGARIYAELKAVGMSADAYDMVAPCTDGAGARLAMQVALKKAALSPQAIGYINCHGTSTLLGDLAETLAIDSLFNKQYANVKIGSTKSMTGHMIGAAAALEGIIAVLALHHQRVPPNINLFELDEQIPIPAEVLPTAACDHPMQAVLSNSFGFGGHNSSVVFTALD